MPLNRLGKRLALLLLTLVLLALVGIQPQATTAADPPTYYPETGHYLGGGFRDFWRANGQLQVFGYPITEEYRAANGRVTQWFERARFEIAPNGAIELGLLGRESTVGRVFPQIPPHANDANHRFFPETSHMVMWGFKTIWETKGGLPVFGFPISEEIDEILPADNKWHTVQYFERVRFEYWPDFPAGQRVLISDLGRRLAPRELTAPLPPGSPPGSVPPAPTPPPAPAPTLPPNVDATVNPSSGPVGTVFSFNAFGFQPGEEVSLWATGPDGEVAGADFVPIADGDGSLTSSGITFQAVDGITIGVWALTAQGRASGKASIGYLEVTGNQTTPPPPGGLPSDSNARVDPREGAQGTVFRFYAGGFEANEDVSIAAFNSNGDIVSNVITVPADGNGSLDYAQITFTSSDRTTPDVYQLYAQGVSGREAFAYFRVLPRSTTALGFGATGAVQWNAPVNGTLSFTPSK